MTIHLENPRGVEFYYRLYGESDWVRLEKGETLIQAGQRCEVSQDGVNIAAMLISLAVGAGGTNSEKTEPLLPNNARQRLGDVGRLVYAKGR